MIVNQPNEGAAQGGVSKVNLLGILSFLLGAPHLYAFLKERQAPSKTATGVAHYAAALLLAGAFAGWLEFSTL